MDVAAVKKQTQASVRQRLRLELLDYVGQQRAVTRCADCRWSYRGLIRDGKKAFRAHREMQHS
jgi:hypothetical protein